MRKIGDLLDQLDSFSLAEDFGEPGYTKESHLSPIVLANWNGYEGIQEALEELGCTTEWEDEWIVCGRSLAWRNQPDSYSWSPSFIVSHSGEVITVRDDIEDWIGECACTDYMQEPRLIPKSYDLTKAGFIKFSHDDYESGFFEGMNDDPKEVLSEILKMYPHAEVCFQGSPSQFYVSWAAFYRTSEE